jgi:hypothetical protein
MDSILVLKYTTSLLPMLMGLGVIFFERTYTKWKHSARGISPSYFASVALLFALFASLIFSEVWGKITKTNALMTQQANSLRALLRLTEPLGPDSIRVSNAVKNYIQKLKEQEVNDDMLAQSGFSVYKQQSFTKKTFQEFYEIASDTSLFKGFNPLHNAFYSELESVREAWFERRELRKQHIPSTKIAVLFIFGFFTQLAIAFSHIGNNNATRATVMLFSLAFATSIALLAYIDNPHQTSYLVSTGVLDDIR